MSATESVNILAAYKFGQSFTYPDSSAIHPYDIKVDKYGSVFILDNISDRSTGTRAKVVKFNSNYIQDLSWGDKIFVGTPEIAIDSLNRILIINPSKSQINIYSDSGTFLDSINNAGVFSDALRPDGIGEIDAANGKIFVLDINNKMRTFDYAGAVIDSVSLPYYGYFKVSNTGDVFMSYAYEILQISNGNIINRWGRQGSGIGEFQYARQLCFDKAQKLFVVDEKNNRVQAFDLSGSFFLRFSLVDFYNFTPYSSPSGICVSITNNNLLVGTDSSVLVFSRK
jgi:hypothetical protein